MKIYTTYSKSHEVFLPWFDTIHDVEKDADIVKFELQQKCPTGEFKSEGWNDTTAEKLERIISIYDDTDTSDTFIFSDIDVQFFSPIIPLAEKALKQHDIVFQNDYYGVECTGFFYCRKTTETKKVFETALKINKEYRDDQESVQASLRKYHSNVQRGLLPPQFFTFGMFYNMWQGQTTIPLPRNIVLHHANWVSGVEGKLKLLKAVRENYNQKNFFNT